MTCKNCIHYEVCSELNDLYEDLYADGSENCSYFKDKAKFIELPCKVGDIVYGNFYKKDIITKGIVVSVKPVINKFHKFTTIEVEYEYIDPYYNDGRKSKCGAWARYEEITGGWCIASLDFDKANELLEKYLIEKHRQC